MPRFRTYLSIFYVNNGLNQKCDTGNFSLWIDFLFDSTFKVFAKKWKREYLETDPYFGVIKSLTDLKRHTEVPLPLVIWNKMMSETLQQAIPSWIISSNICTISKEPIHDLSIVIKKFILVYKRSEINSQESCVKFYLITGLRTLFFINH